MKSAASTAPATSEVRGAEGDAGTTSRARAHRPGLVDLGGDRVPPSIALGRVERWRSRHGAASIAAQQMRLDRVGRHPVDTSVAVGAQVGGGDVPSDEGAVKAWCGHARASLRSRRARSMRVLTVPLGIPSSNAASFVVRPSRMVACTTARSSGASRSSARPRSPCCTPMQHLLLGRAAGAGGADRAAGRAGDAAAAGGGAGGGCRSPTATPRPRRCRDSCRATATRSRRGPAPPPRRSDGRRIAAPAAR